MKFGNYRIDAMLIFAVVFCGNKAQNPALMNKVKDMPSDK